MNRYYYIYLINNLLNGKQYVGSKMYDCEKKDKIYMGSSKYINADIILFGIENFSKVILEENMLFISKEELLERESYYIHLYDTLNPNGYNRYDPVKCIGFCSIGIKWKQTEQAKQNMRHPRKPTGPMSKERKENIRKSLIGIKHSEQRKQNTRHPKSEEAKQNMRHSEQAKQNMRHPHKQYIKK